MIGGTLMQTLTLVWVTIRTDWNKEVQLFYYRASYH
jgi:MATE family multidrug resistance protein